LHCCAWDAAMHRNRLNELDLCSQFFLTLCFAWRMYFS
jgi:hypothetical protein